MDGPASPQCLIAGAAESALDEWLSKPDGGVSCLVLGLACGSFSDGNGVAANDAGPEASPPDPPVKEEAAPPAVRRCTGTERIDERFVRETLSE